VSLKSNRLSHQGLAWFIWSLATIFFAYQFILRLAPGLIIDQMMVKYNISASEYGLFSSMYYLGYAGMQIPIALLLDKYGPRVVGGLCILLCAMSSIVFILSDSWAIALISRVLIGTGSAAAFLTVSKVISMWFDEKYYGRMVSITFSFGLIGAVYGGKPVNDFIDSFGWVDAMIGVGISGIMICLVFLLFVRSADGYKDKAEEKVVDKLLEVCTNKNIILVACGNLLLVGALEGFADVWGVSYLVKIYGYTKSDASMLTSFVFVGMIFGAPLLALFAERLEANYALTAICGAIMAASFFAIILFDSYIGKSLIYFLVFIIGIACCYQVLVFTIGSSLVKPSLIGVTIAFLNSINMIGGTFFHTVIGQTMDRFWDGKTTNGVKIYNAIAYQYSLLSIPIASLVGTFIFLAVGSYVRNKKNKATIVEYH
jgi:predicted MFS family arabinose efflux permease